MIIHTVLYSSCIYESAYYTESSHLTKKGAFLARQKLLRKKYNQWREDNIRYGKDKSKFMQYESCILSTQEVQN